MVIAAGVAASTALSVGGAIASSSIQSNAARRAAQTQAESADAAIQLQREQFDQTRKDLAPWRQAGQRGLAQFEQLARQGPPTAPTYTAPQALDPRQFATQPFTPPTGADLERDPSYRFRLTEGQRALERGASARGGLLSGGTLRGLERYAQDYASTEYGNVYNRAQAEYQNRLNENQLAYGRALTADESQYGRGLQQYTTRYNVGQQQFQNRLAPFQTLAGFGQQATQQGAQLGQGYAQNVGEILQGQGSALAAGQVGQANAISGGLSNLSGLANQAFQNYYLGQQRQNNVRADLQTQLINNPALF